MHLCIINNHNQNFNKKENQSVYIMYFIITINYPSVSEQVDTGEQRVWMLKKLVGLSSWLRK